MLVAGAEKRADRGTCAQREREHRPEDEERERKEERERQDEGGRVPSPPFEVGQEAEVEEGEALKGRLHAAAPVLLAFGLRVRVRWRPLCRCTRFGARGLRRTSSEASQPLHG